MSDTGPLITTILELSRELGYSADEYLVEKIAELQGRIQLRMRPAGHLSQYQVDVFLKQYLHREATKEERERARLERRSTRLSEDERTVIERRQNDRCANCGRFLDRDTQPHVDHRVPIALGGPDTFDNLQLLCGHCNMGKGHLPVWQVGIPYIERRLTKRLRYCVLARAHGSCQWPKCPRNISTCELKPVLQVPASMGGAWVFDNLIALCELHAGDSIERRLSANLQAVKTRTLGANSEKRRVLSVRMRQTR